MDPAMDWGMRFAPHGEFDPGKSLEPEQLCWIMDEMAAAEVAWHQGGTLAQTVFSSLHYHNAANITPNIAPDHQDYADAYATCIALRAYVLAFAKGVEIAYSELLNSGNGVARDGEDLWLDTYGIPISTAEGVDDVVMYVDHAIFWLEGQGYAKGWWSEVTQRLRFRKVCRYRDDSTHRRHGSMLSSSDRYTTSQRDEYPTQL